MRPDGIHQKLSQFAVDILFRVRIVEKPGACEAAWAEQLCGFSASVMTHYHDCVRCGRSLACVCQTPKEKIFCLGCWEGTQQGLPTEEMLASDLHLASNGRDISGLVVYDLK